MALTRIDSYLVDLDSLGGITFDDNAGTPTFKVDAVNHRVGIGHNSPAYKLDVVGDINISSGSNFLVAGSQISTANVAEDSSYLYYTNARARSSISVTDSGGDGSLSYDSGTGVITYTGPSAADVRAHFTAGTGISITNGSISVDDDGHNHLISNIDGLQTALDLKAPLASPALTGTPTAPTAAAGTNTTQIATTAFVSAGLANLVDSAPGALDTLNELAAALGDDANFSTTITNSIATKLPLAGGQMTGNIDLNGNNLIEVEDIGLRDRLYSDGDTNTYIQFHATDSWRVVTGNAERLEVNNTQTTVTTNLLVGSDLTTGLWAEIKSAGLFMRRPVTLLPNGGGDATSTTTTKNSEELVFMGKHWDGSASVDNYFNISYDVESTTPTGKVYFGFGLDNNASSVATLASDGTWDFQGNNLIEVEDIGLRDRIFHDGDTDTYIQFHAADQWRVVTGGAERLEVNNTQTTINQDATVNGEITIGGSSVSTTEGGEIRLTKPTNQTTGDTYIDLNSANLRFFHSTSPNKGAYINLSNCADAVGSRILTTSDEGSGNGLDADTVDGIQGGSFLRSDATDTATGAITFTNDTTISNEKYIGYSSTYNYKPRVTGGIGTRSEVITAANLLLHADQDGSGTTEWLSIRAGGGTANELKITSKTAAAGQSSSALTYNGGQVWHAGNDGSGSGLDADTLDSLQASSFLRSDANDTLSAIITGHASDTEVLRVRSSSYSSNYLYIGGWSSANSNDIARIRSSSNLHIDGPADGNLYLNWYASNKTIHLGNTGQVVKAAGYNTVWHGGNDGAGSGLDADTLDGIQSLDIAKYNDYAAYDTVLEDSGFISYYALNTGARPTTGSTYWSGIQSVLYNDKKYGWQLVGNSQNNHTEDLYVRKINNNTYGSWSRIWTAASDGSGSGLDADKLDGQEGSYYQNATNLISGTIPDDRITDIGDSQARIITLDNLEKSYLTADGQLGFDSSQGLLVYRAQQGTSGATTTVLDGWNTAAGTGISITNLGAGGTGTEQFTFSLATIAGASDYGTLLRSNAADTATGKITFSGGHEAQATFLSGAQNFNNIKTSGFFSLYNVNASGHTNAPFQYGTMISVSNTANNLGMGMQLAHERLNDGLYVRGMNDSSDTWSSWAEVWTSNTDGAGSGLDADTVDGVQASSFLRSDATATATGTLTFNGRVNIRGHLDLSDEENLDFGSSDDVRINYNSNNWLYCDFRTGNGIAFRDNGVDTTILEDSGIFRPQVNGTGSLGTSSSNWGHVYATTISCGGELNMLGSSDANKYIDCRVGSNSLSIRKTTGGDAGHETMAKFVGDGGVELYHNNVKKFETTSTGATLVDTLTIGGTANQMLLHPGGTQETAIHRNDGTNYYILLSAAGAAPSGSWNTLRPFYINTNTGMLHSNNGQSFTGGLTTTGAVTIDVDNQATGALRILADQTNPNADFYFAQEIETTLSGSTATSADREQGGLWIDVDSSATGGDTNHEHRAYGIYIDLDSTGDADLVYGIYSDATATPTAGTASEVIGVYGRAEDNGGAGSVTIVTGVRGEAVSDNSTSDINNMYGGYFRSTNVADTGNINAAHGCYAEIEIPASTGDHYGDSYVFRAEYDNNDTATAQTNTTYLYYGNYAGILPTTAFGIHIADDVKNHFGGDVGIGTDAPGSKLHTVGTRNYTGSAPSASSYDNNFQSGTAVLGIGQSNGIPAIQGFGTGTAYHLVLAPNNGNVGIGTSGSPSAKLDVNGNIHGTKLAVGTASNPGTNVDICLGADNDTGFACPSDGVLEFWANNAEVAQFTNTGINFYETIDSNQTIQTSAGLIECGEGSGSVAMTINDGYGNANLTFNHASGVPDVSGSSARIETSVDSTNAQMIFELKDSVTANSAVALTHIMTMDIGAVSVTGSISATADITAYSSDRRLKENFRSIEEPIDKIKKLNGYIFDWNDKSEEVGFNPRRKKDEVGLIAQEVQDVIPQAVAPAPFDSELNHEGTEFISLSGENYLTVQYEKLVPLLIEAIKDQQKQIDELRVKLEEK